MTRRGNMVYYSAAVAIPAFIDSVVFAAGAGYRVEGRIDFAWLMMSIAGFTVECLFGILWCVVFGMLLKRIAVRMAWISAWQWALTGAVLWLGIVLAASFVSKPFHPVVAYFLSLPVKALRVLAGPFFLLSPPGLLVFRIGSWWATLLLGFLLGIALHRIHRFYASREENVLV